MAVGRVPKRYAGTTSTHASSTAQPYERAAVRPERGRR